VLSQSKDLEKKIKSLEADLAQLQEGLSAAERQCRMAEAERDELAEEFSATGSKVALSIDEKRLDVRIAALEGKLEEEQTQFKMLMD
jgi:myosin protein heavy chain